MKEHWCFHKLTGRETVQRLVQPEHGSDLFSMQAREYMAKNLVYYNKAFNATTIPAKGVLLKQV